MDRSSITRIVKSIVAPLAQRVRLAISRGVVSVVNDGLKCQGLQVELLADEVRDDVERWQEYGFTSVPQTDGNAEALFLSIGGNRSHGAVACVMNRNLRPKDLTEGDVCLFTDKGERVYLDTTNDIVHIGAKSGAEWVAQAAKTKTELDALKTTIDNFINAHKLPGSHTTTATVGPSAVLGVITSSIGTTHGTVGEVAATKAKVT